MINFGKKASLSHRIVVGVAIVCILLGAVGGWIGGGFVSEQDRAQAWTQLDSNKSSLHGESPAKRDDVFLNSAAGKVTVAEGQAAQPRVKAHALPNGTEGADSRLASSAHVAQASMHGNQPQAGTAVPAVELFTNGEVMITLPEMAADSAGASRYSASQASLVQLPIAVALAADSANLPPALQKEVKEMAADFARDLNAGGAMVDAASPAYAQSWTAAVARSDQQFKMNYGRTAYIRFNLLMAQEAAINAY